MEWQQIRKVWLRRLFKIPFDVLYPTTCVLCKDNGNAGLDLCAACYNDLPHNSYPCARCAVPLPSSGYRQGMLCAYCQQKTSGFDRCLSAFAYATTVAFLIKGLKFKHNLVYGCVLGSLFTDYVADHWQTLEHMNQTGNYIRPKCIIPVPLHSTRLKERGFNQALEVAKITAKRLKLPLDTSSVIRSIPTTAQTRLNREQRMHNIRDAFSVIKGVPESVAIVDDVITTGVTVDELARTLKQAGVKWVEAWSVARTESL